MTPVIHHKRALLQFLIKGQENVKEFPTENPSLDGVRQHRFDVCRGFLRSLLELESDQRECQHHAQCQFSENNAR